MKSHTRFRLVPKSMTLGDMQRADKDQQESRATWQRNRTMPLLNLIRVEIYSGAVLVFDNAQ